MNRNLLMPMAVPLILLSGCKYNDDSFEGLDEITQPTNLIKIECTLTDADYAAISTNSINGEIAGKDLAKDLVDVKTGMYLTGEITGATYIPTFLLDKYYTTDKGSGAKTTYRYKEAMSVLLSEYAPVKYLKPTDADYELVYDENAFAPYLDEKTEDQMYKMLNENFRDTEKGTAVFAGYKLDEGQLENPLMWQDFETLPTGGLIELKGWFPGSIGETEWKVTSYDDNQYVQYSVNKMEGECIAWMVIPAVSVVASDYPGSGVTVGCYNANYLSVLILEDSGGKGVRAVHWTDVTLDFNIPTKPTSGHGTFAPAGKVSLSTCMGKKACVAFKYVNDGTNKKTTTYQINNIMVGTSVPANSLSTPARTVKMYDGKSQRDKSNNVYTPTLADYEDIEQSKHYFAFGVPTVSCLSAYLSRMAVYLVSNDAHVVVYRFYNDKVSNIYSDEYTYSAEKTGQELNTRIVDKIEQFVLSDGKWSFDPSIIITLKAEKGNAGSAAFYQVITDWVKENHPEYVTPYGNNDYYYGGSARNNNFDLRSSAWKTQSAFTYSSISDVDLTKLMFERPPETFLPGLKVIYSSADVMGGVDVFYTINSVIYDGFSITQYTIKYKVTGKGQFEYAADSSKKIE